MVLVAEDRPKRGKRSVLPNSPAWTFGARHRALFADEAGPGPGAYTAEQQYTQASTSRHSASYTIGGGRDVSKRQQTPGPGAFNSDAGRLLPRKPAYSLRTRTAPAAAGDRTPGPGSYAPRRAVAAVEALSRPRASSRPSLGSLQERCCRHAHRCSSHSRRSLCGQGPGAGLDDLYDACRADSRLLGSHPNASSYTFGLRSEAGKDAERRPGPNEYHIAAPCSAKAASLKFRHEKVVLREAAAPGPAEYSVTGADRPRAPAFTFGEGHERTQVIGARPERPDTGAAPSELPGPSGQRPPRSWSFGRSRRMPASSSEAGPGPGEYPANAGARLTMRSAPSAGFAGGRDIGRAAATPGPGAFNPVPSSPGRPAYTIVARHAPSAQHGTPGPGTYGPRTESRVLGHHPNGASYSFGLRAKSSSEQGKKPGPNEYLVLPPRSAKAASMKFRHSPTVLREAQSPGPGEYRISCKTCGCSTTPGFTMGVRTDAGSTSTQLSSSPGPGAYPFE